MQDEQDVEDEAAATWRKGLEDLNVYSISRNKEKRSVGPSCLSRLNQDGQDVQDEQDEAAIAGDRPPPYEKKTRRSP